MQDKIICLVGPSGSGKTTIAKELEKLGYNIIHSYTTRKPREEGEWGHIFVGEDGWAFRENVIAERELYDEAYWATREQYKNKGISIYVVCPDGAKQVQESVKDAEVITIFLMADESIRLKRMYTNRTIHESTMRAALDRKIFKTCKCNYVIDANRELEEVVKDVIEIIEGEI